MEHAQLPALDTGCAEAHPQPNSSAFLLSRFLDEQLRDITGHQVPRVVQLLAQLQAASFQWDNAPLAGAVELLRDRANQLDFDALGGHGIFSIFSLAAPFSRLNRTHSSADFAAHYGRVLAAAAALRRHANQLTTHCARHGCGARRTLLELDLARKSLSTDLAYAVEWLGAMSKDLRGRDAHGEQEGGMSLLAKRVGFFTGHLKRLHMLQDLAMGACGIGRNVIARRAALVERLRVDLDEFQKAWQHRVGNVASEAPRALGSATRDAAFQAHGELLARLEDTCAACEALQVEEHQLALRLAAMREELEVLRG